MLIMIKIIYTPSVLNYNLFEFLTLNLTTHLIQKKIVQIELNLNYFRRTFIDKVSHNKKSDILHKFLNTMSGHNWV